MTATTRAGRFHIEIDQAVCIDCAGCVSICPTRALDMIDLDLHCEDGLCIGCDLCVRFCPVRALGLEDRREIPVRRTAGATA